MYETCIKECQKYFSAKNLWAWAVALLPLASMGQAKTDSQQQSTAPRDSTDISKIELTTFHQSIATEVVPSSSLELLSTVPLGHIVQGQATGIWALQTSAQPAGLTSLWIRGYNSSNASNQPLIVLDGVSVYHNAPFAEGVKVGLLSLISPYDIASVEIIKDGSAAYYGMRGYNGTIIIKSKQGKAGKLKISLDNKIGFQKPSKLLALMDAQQYATFVNEYYEEQDSVVYTQKQIQALGKGTDWQKELYRVAPVWQSHLSASGGSRKNQYFVSGSYMDQLGIIVNSGVRRYTLLANLRHQLTSRLSITEQVSYAQITSQLVPYDAVSYGLSSSPILPVRDSLGNYSVRDPQFEINPIELVDKVDIQNRSSQVFSKIAGVYRVWDSLSFTIDAGIFGLKNNYLSNDNFQRRLEEKQRQEFTFFLEPALSYQRRWKKHEFYATLGYAFQEYKQHNVETRMDLEKGQINSFAESRLAEVYRTPFWTSLSYQYDERYQLLLKGRFENYQFLTDNRAFSSAAAVAWHLHHERFAEQWANQTEITLRTSCGTIQKPYSVYILAGNNSKITNYLDKNRQWNAGVDIALFHRRLAFSLDTYQKETDNLLSVSLSESTGYNSRIAGKQEVLNQGLEISMSTCHRFGKVEWNSRLNVSSVRSRITRLPDNIENIVSFSRPLSIGFVSGEGSQVGAYYGFKDSGIFTNNNEVITSGQPNAQRGRLKFLDVSGDEGRLDGVINTDDITAIGHAQPTWTIGLNQYLKYNRWTMEALLYASVGNETLNFQKYFYQSGDPSFNQHTRMLNRWSPERPASSIPAKLTARYISSYVVENASFLRLRHITLSYRLPGKLASTLYASAQNLYTFTVYQGYDPEVSHFGQKTDALGVDYDSYPRTKTFLLGWRMSF